MRDITLMPNDYIVTHIKTDTICEHFSNDDVVYAVDERIVPLVRCKECKWSEPTNDGWNSVTCNFYGETTLTMPTDGFCSYGERSADGVELVKCEDCKHWYPDADCGMACEFTNMSQPNDGYCNWGVPKRTEREGE